MCYFFASSSTAQVVHKTPSERMSIPIKEAATCRRDIVVIAKDQEPARQPNTFQFCPLGVQCYCHDKMDEYKVVDFNMQLPADDGSTEEIDCSGIVVACNQDKHSALYRVWIKFVKHIRTNT